MRFALCLLALLIALSGAAHADTAVAADFYKKGMAAYALEDWDAAIGLFEKGFREEPKPEFLYNIGQAHRQAGRHEQAMRFYQRYLDLKPDATDRAEVERLIRVLRKSISEKQRATSAPPVGIDGAPVAPATPEQTEPPQALGPAAAPPAEGRRMDPVAVGLITSGAVVAAAGIGLAVSGAIAGGKATDQATVLDLGDREQLHRSAGTQSVVGYCLLGASVALLAGGIIKLALRPKSGVAVGVGAASRAAALSLAGSF